MVGIAGRERFSGGMENEKGVLGVRNLTVIDFSLGLTTVMQNELSIMIPVCLCFLIFVW